jgi:hypothetical protein
MLKIHVYETGRCLLYTRSTEAIEPMIPYHVEQAKHYTMEVAMMNEIRLNRNNLKPNHNMH